MATRQSAAAYDFLRWMAGWAITRDVGGGWLIAYHGGGWSQGAPERVTKWSAALPAASNSIKWWRWR